MMTPNLLALIEISDMARKREFDKETVLEKAMMLFWAQGYEATSIDHLKKAMGISTSSMYETFGDKRGIFLQALTRFCEQERQQLTELAEQTPSAPVLIETLFDAIDMVVTNRDANHGSLAFNTMIEFGAGDTDINAIIYEHYANIIDIIATALQSGQEKTSVTTEFSSTALAHLIMNTLHGLATVKGAQPHYNQTDSIKQIILSLITP